MHPFYGWMRWGTSIVNLRRMILHHSPKSLKKKKKKKKLSESRHNATIVNWRRIIKQEYDLSFERAFSSKFSPSTRCAFIYVGVIIRLYFKWDSFISWGFIHSFIHSLVSPSFPEPLSHNSWASKAMRRGASLTSSSVLFRYPPYDTRLPGTLIDTLFMASALRLRRKTLVQSALSGFGFSLCPISPRVVVMSG